MNKAPCGGTYGYATIHPQDEVICGTYGTWTITFTAGLHGIDNGGALRIAMRTASNWGMPQFEQPDKANYVTVSTTGQAKLHPSYDPRGHVRPWPKALTIRVYDGSLFPGDTVAITFGDTSGGGPGARAQTFPEDSFEFRVLVDPAGTGEFLRLPMPPTLRLVGGPAAQLRAILPSQAMAGEPFALLVRAEDRWGNPAPSYAGTIQLSASCEHLSLPDRYTFSPSEGGVHRFERLVLAEAGICEVTASDEEGDLSAVSNPLVCQEEPGLKLFWGDLHGQTEDTVGTGTVAAYFRYGRDVAGLDFLAHVGNDFQITEAHFQDVAQRVREFNEPGRFVTFLAYEWSGNTPVGGDHNVYFLHEGEQIHRSGHWLIPDKWDEDTDCYSMDGLCSVFRGRKDVLIIPHIGGRRANLDFFDPELMPAIEIYSCHGVFEWFVREALERGLVVGFLAGSDDHSGRPGATYGVSHSLNVRGGLGGVWARELSREGLWEALQARRCYATTGERILLDVRADGHLMGEEYTSSNPPELRVWVLGTDSLRKVEVFRGLELVHSHRLYDPSKVISGRIELAWTGARLDSRNRHTTWDGELILEGGKIISAGQFGMEGPEQGIVEWDAHRVRWLSSTAGNVEGLILDLDAAPGARLTFSAQPAEFSFTLGELRQGPVEVEAGGLGQKVSVGQVPAERGPKQVSFTYADANPPQGLNPYYVRVTQFDGAMAWSSPIYVHQHPSRV